MDLEDFIRLSTSHRERLQWFLDRTGTVSGWPTPLPDGSFLVTRPKGIFKPRDLPYALSIRIQANSPYADGEIHHRADGSWYFAYHHEGDDPDVRDREYANVGLVECMRVGLPVGVMRQVDKHPLKPVAYDVLGLAVPVWWEDGYFFFEGLLTTGQLGDADLPEIRHVIRQAATAAREAVRANRDTPSFVPDAVAPHEYPDRRRPASVDVERVEPSIGLNAMSDSVSIRPGVAMLGLFPHMKYDPWYALGELVDNGIQSYLSNRDRLQDAQSDYRLRIEIEIDRTQGGTIVVRDNAAGIAHGDWQRAFLVAEPPADATGLSQFGVGMKAACCWFAKNWSLRTSHLGEEIIRSVSFDIPEIVATRDESLAVLDEATDWRTHFTEIRMTNLYRTPQTKTQAKIKEYLGAIYRQFLRNGDVELFFNGDPISFQEHPVLTAPLWSEPGGEPITWRKDVDLRLDSGRRVKGFVAIRERGATRSAGLALFYRNKVVTGAGEDTYRPEEIFGRSNDFRSQRIFGELHMDDFNVTYTKDALVWYDEEEEFIEALRQELEAPPKPLLRQAKEYRARQVDPTPVEVTEDMAEGILSAFQRASLGEMDTIAPSVPIEYVSLHDVGVDADGNSTAAPSIEEQVRVDREMKLDIKGATWTVLLRLSSDEGNENWLTVLPNQQDSEPRLTLTVNQAHPFMRAFCELPGQELEPVWRVAVALGLGQELARKGGAKMPGLVTTNVNALLRNVLSRKV